ncbi:DUF1476 domain-containing protein [Nitratireductor basaltis]|uniref:HpcH/HpaI aldolase n=1 Tax=Nitratireductor basaltis TaxID=472175 RepID=A0A084UBF2_9HYPH|nr:DUF1476 domain-containing protein [Nitratireductor basaltis]KFB10288.1 hypothetical protein EL18_01319 [Nitratireductor basaltis]
MGSMEERERAFENKFVRDEETKFRAMARRNKLLGLWVAEKIGKKDEEAEAYARDVVKADFEEAGDEDVFRKVRADLDASGASISDADLRAEMVRLLEVAIDQVKS